MKKGSLQVKGKSYYAVFRVNGRQKWVPLHIPAERGNKRKAEAEMAKVVEHYLANPARREDMLFVDYLREWVEDVRPSIKPVSYETYRKIVYGKLIPYFEGKKLKLSDLCGKVFGDYFTYLNQYGNEKTHRGLSRKTIMNIRGVLSSALDYAASNDWIEKNVIPNSRIPAETKKPVEAVIYTPEQITALLEHVRASGHRITTFLFLLALTGARKGEILGLTWDNVDLDGERVYICQNCTGSKKETYSKPTSPKTKNGYRYLSIPATVVEILRAEREQQMADRQLWGNCYAVCDQDYVIRQADGRKYNPNSVNRIVNRFAAEIGLPHCRMHDFRHAVATMLFESGASLVDVCTQLGHGQTSTTERIYIHKSNIAKKENADSLAKMLGM